MNNEKKVAGIYIRVSTEDQVIRIFNLYHQGNSYQTISNLYNKEKATKHMNQEMEESAEDFYTDKEDKEKDDCLSL